MNMFKKELLGEFVTVSDEDYYQWLNDKLDSLYELDWQSSPNIEAQLDFFENQIAECAYRLGVSGRLR